MTSYAVYYERESVVPTDELLPTSTEAAAVQGVPHRTVQHATSLELEGLHANTDYALMVLARNAHGWGHRWSAPLLGSTDGATDAPPAAEAPTIRRRPDDCELVLELPTPRPGCAEPSEFLVQVEDATSGSGAWSTVGRFGGREVVVLSGEAAEAAAVVGAHVRLVARNAQGEAPPGPGTLLPHPSECEGRRAWRTRIAVYAMGALVVAFFIGGVLRCCRFLQRALFGGGYAKVGGTEAPLAEAVLNTPFHGGRAVGRAFDDGSDDDEAIARFAEMVADAEAQAPRNGTHKAAEVELLDAAGEAALLGRISALLSTEEGGAQADGDGGGGGGPLAANARLHWSEGAEAPQLRFAI